MTVRLLVLNAGSGTVTAAVFRRPDPGGPPLRSESATLVHHSDPPRLETGDGELLPVSSDDRGEQMDQVLDSLDVGDVSAVGHRIVHGGTLGTHAVIDEDVRRSLDDASLFAPLHNPPALELVDRATTRVPDAEHVACLDTAFHTTIPPEAAVYGGPKEWWDRGLRRYGFHGISHQDAARRAAAVIGRSVDDLHMVTVHAGGGVSATAVRNGRSVDTTMGLTPLEGPVMAARSGSVDPGLLIHLLRHDRLTVDELEALLTERSGLLGLSGVSGGEATLRGLPEEHPDAELALAAYAHSLSAGVASLLPSLARFDLLVLTGDVLESDAELRADLCRRLRSVGVELDPTANDGWRAADRAGRISAPGSDVGVVAVTAGEEFAIAGLTLATLGID